MDDDVSCGAPAWVPSLDGVRMRAIGTGDTGQVDGNTLFVFSQHGNTISARYSGGAVEPGYLVGRVTADRLVFRYCQVDLRGDVHGGRSACLVGLLPDGRLRLQEHFHWESREGSGTNVLEEAEGRASSEGLPCN
jgi:hypothetical protein